MAAKKINELEGYKFSTFAGRKFIRVSEILTNTDMSRDTVDRRIADGTLEKRKIGGKVYVSWDSYMKWTNG